MSCYEWETGVIKLPSVEYPRVRKAVQEAATEVAQKVYNHAQAFWRSLPTRAKSDWTLYDKYLRAYIYGNDPNQEWNYDPKMPVQRGIATTNAEYRNSWTEDLNHVLGYVIKNRQVTTEVPMSSGGSYTRHEMVRVEKPRRVQRKDVSFPTNKTTHFSCGESFIVFDPKGRTVEWNVPENNHARDHGRKHPVARALFAALSAVRWTRGSGGEIIGNDEYNRESMSAGGGGNYIIDVYGPKAKPRSKFQSAPFAYR